MGDLHPRLCTIASVTLGTMLYVLGLRGMCVPSDVRVSLPLRWGMAWYPLSYQDEVRDQPVGHLEEMVGLSQRGPWTNL